MGGPCGVSAGRRARFGTDSDGGLGPLPPTAEAIVMHRNFPAKSVALFGGILSTLAAASVAAIRDDWWDPALLIAAGILGVLYYLPLLPLVRFLASKRVHAVPVLVGAVGLSTIFVPPLAAVVGPELAQFQAPLLAWAVLALGATVFVQDVEPALVPAVCNRCDYDLTGNKTGVCPECGRPVDEPGHVRFAHRWRAVLLGPLGRWAAALSFSILAAMTATRLVPQFTTTVPVCRGDPNLKSMLQTIRSQIELHNVQNPADHFDPRAHGWGQLVANNYLQTPPRNPLQNGSTKFGTAPAAGVGWFWGSQNGRPVTIYAVNDNGGVYDSDSDGSWD